MAEQREIKYVNRDFNDFRNQLIEYSKNYFPSTYNDFSPTSPGMMFIEMAAYVGDILSFYQDTQIQETFLTYAKDPKNLYSLAYMMGYKPKTTGVSTADIDIQQDIETTGAPDYLPNWDQAAIIPENLQLTSTDNSQTKFLIDRRVDFNFSSSFDPTQVTIKSLDGSGNPSEYTLKKTVKAYSSEIKTTTFNISSAEQFKTLTIQDSNIVGILDVFDDDSNEWYEVPFLGQDTIYESENESASFPHVLSTRRVPRRFVTRYLSTGYLQLQFGAGSNSNDDSTIIPDPTNVGLGSSNGISKFDKAYDPSNFLFSKSYGIAPNSNLTVRYLKGGGVTANVPAGTITSVGTNVTITATGDTSRLTSAYLTFTNPTPAEGGRDGDTIEELRENSLRAFNEQNRAVTLQDYAVRVLSLPPKFGSVAKAYVSQEQLTDSNANLTSIDSYNPFALALYVLAYNNNGKLVTASNTLKQNIKKYLADYIMISDSVNIKDAFIVNIGIEYDIVLRPNYSGRDVITQCNNALKDYFKMSKWSINQSINLNQVFTLLDKITGVQTVQKLTVTNKTSTDGNYSVYSYDISGATKNNIIYPSFDPCIFEVKYPDVDIKGRITTV